MQSTGIQPSQLLMEVLASTQDKIGQNISQSGFSQQLYEQHQLTQNVPFGLTASTFAQQAPSSNPAIPSNFVSSATPPGDGVTLPATTPAASNGVQGSPTSSTAARDLVVSKWKITQQLTFSDSSALEKVLAQFQLSPSVSSPIENALNSEGRVSLQKLNECLDRAYSNKNDLPPDGKAASADIQSLLAAVLQQQQIPVQNLNDLGIQSKGVYDFVEFRELLRQVVNQVARTGRKQSGDSPLPHASDTASAVTKPAADAASASRASLPNQTQSLAANLLPSFLRDENKPSSTLNNHTPAVVVSVVEGNQAFKAQPPTTDATGGGEVSSKSQQSAGELNGAVAPLGSGDAWSTASLLSGAAILPQAFLESISEIVLKSPPGTSDGPASEAEMRLSQASQAITADRMAGKPDADLASASSDKQSVIQPSASILANAANAGEALVRASRQALTGTDLHPEGTPVEETVSANTSIPAVDKIAAPATANSTSPHSGSSRDPDSSSNGSARPFPQGTQRPADTTIKPFSLNASPEHSPQYREKISADQTGPGMTTAAKESGTTATIIEPSKPVDPRGVFRDVIRMQMSTAADDSGARSPLQDTVKAPAQADIKSSPDGLQISTTAYGVDKGPSILRAAIPEQPRTTSAQTGQFPTLTAIGKAASTQTQSAAISASDTSHDFSLGKSPHPVETQRQVSATTTTTVEDAARATSKRIAPVADTPGGPQVTAVVRPDVAGIISLGFPTDGLVTTTPEDSVATDNGKQFLRSTPPVSATSFATVPDSNMDLTGRLESSSWQQTQNRIAPKDPSAPLQQETVAGFEPLKEEGVAPSAATENTLPPKFGSSDAQDLTRAALNRPERDLGQAATESPSRVTPSGSAEGGANTQTSLSQAPFPTESKPGFQNSVELLAKGSVEDKATASKSVPASQEAAEQTVRNTSNESTAGSTPTNTNLEKAAPVAQTSGQSPRQEQEHTPTWFRNDAQMLTLPAAASADKATEMFSSYASSLTAELAQRIQELYRQKRNELTLELQPKHLGRLLVTIGTDDNQVKTVITTESEQIKELLSRSSSVLRQALASQGLVLDQLQINVNSQPSANDQFFDKQGPGTRRNGSKPQAAPSDKELGNSAARRTQIGSADTLINLFV